MARMTGAFVLRNSSVTFDGTEFNNQLSAARLVPETSIQTQKTLDPEGTLQDVDSATWTFEISGPQGNDEDGLTTYLEEHEGEEIEVVFQPKLGSGQKVKTFTVIAMAPEFGGEQGAFGTFSLSLPVQGSPVPSTSV